MYLRTLVHNVAGVAPIEHLCGARQIIVYMSFRTDVHSHFIRLFIVILDIGANPKAARPVPRKVALQVDAATYGLH